MKFSKYSEFLWLTKHISETCMTNRISKMSKTDMIQVNRIYLIPEGSSLICSGAPSQTGWCLNIYPAFPPGSFRRALPPHSPWLRSAGSGNRVRHWIRIFADPPRACSVRLPYSWARRQDNRSHRWKGHRSMPRNFQRHIQWQPAQLFGSGYRRSR